MRLSLNLVKKKDYPQQLTDAEELADSNPKLSLSMLKKWKDPSRGLCKKDSILYKLITIKAKDNSNIALSYTDSVSIGDAIQYYTTHADNQRLSESYYYMGRIFYEQDKYSIAGVYYLNALDIMSKEKRCINIKKNIYRQLGDIYKKHGLYHEAKNMILHSLECELSIGNGKNVAMTMLSLVNIYLLIDKRDSCLFYLNRASYIADSIHNDRIHTLANSQLANYYCETDRGNMGISIIKKLDLSQLTNEDKASVYTIMGDIYKMNKDSDKAVSCFLKVFEYGSIWDKKNATLQIMNLYNEKNNPDSALTYMKLYTQYRDSTNHINSTETVKRMETSYCIEKYKVENECLAIEKQRNALVIVLLFLFFFPLCVALWWKLEERKKQQKKDNALQQARMNTYLKIWKAEQDDAKEKIEALEAELNETKEKAGKWEKLIKEKRSVEIEQHRAEEAIKRQDKAFEELFTAPLMVKIRRALSGKERVVFLTDEEWDQMKLLTNRCFPGFSTGVMKIYSPITEMEMRLCMLMKLKFSNADIQKLLGRTQSAVSMAKTRFMKKVADYTKIDLVSMDHFLILAAREVNKSRLK